MRHCNPPNATLGRRQERSDGASLEHRRCLLWVIFGLQRDPERCPLNDHHPARRRSEATSEKCPKRLRGAVKFPEVLPDGQISKNSCQSPLKKIFLFSIDPDSVQNSSIPSRERGVGHGHERWDGLRWTRQRWRETESQGGFPVSDVRHADERCCCVRQNRVVLAPVAGVKFAKAKPPDRAGLPPSIRGRR